MNPQGTTESPAATSSNPARSRGGILRFRQSQWQPPTVGPAAKQSTILIKHDVTPQNRRVLVFVHGLKGDATKTWGEFPRLVFESPDLRRFDIALFGYPTGGLATIFPGRSELDVVAKGRDLASVIAATLIEQERYDRIGFITHGIGGIITKFCIKELLASDRRVGDKLHSLFLFGTPQFTSRRAVSPASVLSPELKALEGSADAMEELKAFWHSNITHDQNALGHIRVFLEERAIVSTGDTGSQGSGVGPLSSKHRRQLDGGHTKLVKPVNAQDERFLHFRNEIAAIEKGHGGRIVEIHDDPETYVVDVGASAGIKAGDVFHLTDGDDSGTGSAGRSGRLLIVRAVGEDMADCDLEAFEFSGTSQADRMPPRAGAEATRLRGESWINVAPMVAAHRMATDSTRSAHERQAAHVDLLIACTDFLENHPYSFFADTALLHRAHSSLALGRYEEAMHAYTRFTERFPASADRLETREFASEVTLRWEVARTNGEDLAAKIALTLHLLHAPSKQQRAEGVRLLTEVALEDHEQLKAIDPTIVKFVAGVYAKRISGWDNSRVRELLFERYDTDEGARAELAALCNSSDEGDRDKVALEALLMALGYEW